MSASVTEAAGGGEEILYPTRFGSGPRLLSEKRCLQALQNTLGIQIRPWHRPDEVAVRSFGVARCAAKTCALCSLGFLVRKGVCRLLSWGCLRSLFYSPAPRPCFWVRSQKGQVWSWKNSREGALVVAYSCLELPPSAHLQEMQNCFKSACCLLGLSFLL